MTEYTVNSTEGAIVVTPEGFAPASPLLRSAAVVVGGVVSIDASMPEAGLRSLVVDADAAAWWLPFLYGDAVADAVIERANSDTGEDARFTVADQPLTRPTTRFLLGLWLQRWAPARHVEPFPEWLLEAELGMLALDCDPLFVSDQPAADLLTPHVRRLSQSVNYYRTHQGAGGVDEVVGRMTVQAASAALSCVAVDHPELDDLQSAMEQYQSIDRHMVEASAVASDDYLRTVVTEWAASLLTPAVTRSGESETRQGSRPGHRGSVQQSATAPLDWSQVHPRTASAAPDALQWWIWREGDLTGIDVRVDGAGASPERVSSARLFARIELREGTEGIALEPHDDSWVGSAVISAPHDDEEVRVTIYEDAVGTPARCGPTAAEVVATRRTITDAVSARRRSTSTLAPDDLGAPFVAELVHDAVAR